MTSEMRANPCAIEYKTRDKIGATQRQDRNRTRVYRDIRTRFGGLSLMVGSPQVIVLSV